MYEILQFDVITEATLWTCYVTQCSVICDVNRQLQW